MGDYLRRLDALEAKLGAMRRRRLVIVTLDEGDNEDTKIDEARAAHGLELGDVALVIAE